jgi:triosephosphate isomerase
VESDAEVREKASSACESDMSVTVCVNGALPVAEMGIP